MTVLRSRITACHGELIIKNGERHKWPEDGEGVKWRPQGMYIGGEKNEFRIRHTSMHMQICRIFMKELTISSNSRSFLCQQLGARHSYTSKHTENIPAYTRHYRPVLLSLLQREAMGTFFPTICLPLPCDSYLKEKGDEEISMPNVPSQLSAITFISQIIKYHSKI